MGVRREPFRSCVALKKITVPVVVMHGNDDQIVPYAASGPLSAKLLKNSTLKTYKGFPHGMATTEADTINADLLTFLRSETSSRLATAMNEKKPALFMKQVVFLLLAIASCSMGIRRHALDRPRKGGTRGHK